MHIRFRFTLKALFLVTLLVAVLMAWGRMRISHSTHDHAIARTLERRRATAYFENTYHPTSETLLERLLRKALGDDRAGTVRAVGIHVHARDEIWKHLQTLEDLEALYLSGFTLRSTEDIDHIASLQRLRTVSVATVDMNADVRANIARLSHLDVLSLGFDHDLTPVELNRLRRLLPNTVIEESDKRIGRTENILKYDDLGK
jgi:hypothetical protein